MKRIALLMLFATLCLQAQDPNEIVSRVFQLKHANTASVGNMFIGAHKIVFDDRMKTIAVQATRSQMAEFEQLVKRFDVPPPPVPNVEVTIYLMAALPQPAATPLPAELDGVVKQLRSMFSYKGFELIDTQVIRMRAGTGGEASGVVDRGSSGLKTIHQIKIFEATVSSDEKGRAIRLRNLKVGLRVPVPIQSGTPSVTYLDTGISTDIDVHEGQKVVVGKANMDGSDRASIVVLMAKIVD